MSLNATDLALLLSTIVVGLGHLRQLVRTVGRTPWKLGWTWRCLWGEDMRSRRLSQETAQRVEKQTTVLMEVLGDLSILYAIMNSIFILAHIPRFLNVHQEIATTGSMFVQLFARCFQSRIKGAMVDVYQGAHMVFVCLGVGLASSSDILDAIALCACFRCLCSGLFRNLVAAIVWNCIVCIVQICARSLLSDTPRPLLSVLASEVLSTSAAVALAVLIRRSHERVYVAETHRTILQAEVRTMKALLGIVCEVVVELDAELCLLEDSPKLATMLAIHRIDRGTTFPNLIALESDRQRFVATVTAEGLGPPGCGGPEVVSGETTAAAEETPQQLPGVSQAAGALHVTLRSSFDERIEAEVFFCSCSAPDGQRRVYIGVREYADSQPIGQLRARRQRRAERPPEVPGAGGPSVDEACDSTRSTGTSPGSSRRSIRLMLEDRRQTSRSARVMGIRTALREWNLMTDIRMCCHFHRAVVEMRSDLTSLTRLGCEPNFRPYVEAQCDNCGVMREEALDVGSLCRYCGTPQSVEDTGQSRACL